MTESKIPTPESVLKFWFSLERPGKKDDDAVRKTLGGPYELAAGHKLDSWAEDPRERLALILLLDQAPRHLYRKDARAYATDLKAQGLTAHYFAREDWSDFTPRETYHAALPWLHSENPEFQEAVNPVIKRCAEGIPDLRYMGEMADLYRQTIRDFGRFPHRNRLKGIPNAPGEEQYLEEIWRGVRPRLRASVGKPDDGW